MDIKWYLFEQSYLMDINYNIRECTLELEIDAKITFDHPNAKLVNNIEDTYENIVLLFKGVQHIKVTNSLLILNNPNEDIGSIEKLELHSEIPNYSENIFNEIINSNQLSTLIFVSEMMSLEVYFECYQLKKINRGK